MPYSPTNMPTHRKTLPLPLPNFKTLWVSHVDPYRRSKQLPNVPPNEELSTHWVSHWSTHIAPIFEAFNLVDDD